MNRGEYASGREGGSAYLLSAGRGLAVCVIYIANDKGKLFFVSFAFLGIVPVRVIIIEMFKLLDQIRAIFVNQSRTCVEKLLTMP